jgi:hypothetical protein
MRIIGCDLHALLMTHPGVGPITALIRHSNDSFELCFAIMRNAAVHASRSVWLPWKKWPQVTINYPVEPSGIAARSPSIAPKILCA